MDMTDNSMETFVEHVFINLSKRQVKILDNEGYDKEVNWKFDDEGADGFSETVAQIAEVLEPERITYSFAEA